MHFLEVTPDAANLQNHTEINPSLNLLRIFDHQADLAYVAQ